MQFNEKLKELRLKKGISQAELAEKIFVSRSAVAKWENGLGLPSEESFKLLADFFGVQVDELYSDKTTESVIVSKNVTISKSRKLIVIISVACLLIIIIALIAIVSVIITYTCTKPVKYITEMDRFCNMRQTADSIDIEFDNHTGKPFEFTIEDESDINQIMGIIFTVELHDLKHDYLMGDNTYITINQGGKSYSLSVRINSQDGHNYAFSTDELQSKIIDLAIKNGAYDVRIGIAYKVINICAAEDEISLAGNGYDKTALLNLIENDISADYAFVCLLETAEKTDFYGNLPLSEIYSYTYTDRVTLGRTKVLILYEIYQKHDASSYYIKETFPDETNITSYFEYVLGLERPYGVRIYVDS